MIRPGLELSKNLQHSRVQRKNKKKLKKRKKKQTNKQTHKRKREREKRMLKQISINNKIAVEIVKQNGGHGHGITARKGGERLQTS